jgi:hypothetical protein
VLAGAQPEGYAAKNERLRKEERQAQRCWLAMDAVALNGRSVGGVYTLGPGGLKSIFSGGLLARKIGS